MTPFPTAKARVLQAMRESGAPLTVPDLVRLTGADRREVWTHLLALARMKVVWRVNGRRPKRSRALVRWVLREPDGTRGAGGKKGLAKRAAA